MNRPNPRRIFHALALAACVTAFPSAMPASAQGAGAEVTFNLFSIDGLVVGDTIAIDAAYAEKYSVKVPTSFEFLVPREDGVLTLYNTPQTDGGLQIKVSFATPDYKLIENLHFVTLTVPMGTPEERAKALADLMVNHAYPQSVSKFEKPEMMGWRDTTINSYPAVEVVGRYVDPEWGDMFVRVVGIIPEDAAEGVVAISNLVFARTPITDLQDLSRTRAGVALSRFKFRAE